MKPTLSFAQALFPCGWILMVPFAAFTGGRDGMPKSFREFERSAETAAQAPSEMSGPLCAMWHAKAGRWERAHDIAQDIETPAGSWIHAFLHREEGDLPNAGYWYRRAGKTMPDGVSIAEEWSYIARELWRQEYGSEAG